ncbi:FAD-dependent monooxygenase [Frateuria aurantia]|uniref:2-polyprenyl-6-methoxyphenol hydroxylase-like oxidoreductase n=1 Tax=Frateuria aurantia (strain ATCC 33424 / DSM 6220 / KCTC 2777 / LMG 1558 / NBRC 3245 / NCIMB 13370) TaxID=767434 RepID=H8L3X7_FRAAD|nr:FAD-dependent monooxygenase [Frateuria aurantia]AFC85571.1 2-polyprenyl-6-methoxyphenol hydroxylase-like oxidoreductase [Frateuria aurantia DSM 6220]
MLNIGINGGGIGGLAAAIALQGAGHRVTIFEQASQFGRVGADINLTPNAVRALDGLGVGDRLRETAAWPTARISRAWDTGEQTSYLEMAGKAERDYGAPQLTMHRADVIAALEEAVVPDSLQLGRQTVAYEADASAATLVLADGSRHRFDLVVGADGIHSGLRRFLFGEDHPQFTGIVSYRAVIPSERLPGLDLGAFVKWWGPSEDLQIVSFPLNRGREIFVFATTAQPEWSQESWTTPGDADALRARYRDFHPQARALLQACDTVLASALHVRDPLPAWSGPHMTLLGDACHPMMPFMAQGAGMAIEDAVVLARSLEGLAPMEVEVGLARYETARRQRTASIQIGSRCNQWLKDGSNADWVYGYDAWHVSLN